MNILRVLKYLDWFLLVGVLLLSVIGTMAVYSASYQLSAASGILYFKRQVIWMVAGLLLFLILSAVDYRKVVAHAYFLAGCTTFLLVAIVILGETRFGARRWIQIGGFTVQPSEFAKITLILMLARFLSVKVDRRRRWSYILLPCLMAAIPALLILKQPDLGTALIFLPVTLGVIFVAGGRLKYILIILLILALLAPAFWFFLKDYQKTRLLVFINPDLDPSGAGYTILQSKIAIGSGGIWGKGWLAGTQNMLSFLPERQTDFIFSVVAEEWGFAGCLLVLAIYAFIFLRLFIIGWKCREMTGKLLVAGGILVLAGHVGINIGMAAGLLPATGLPLPLISYGGSVTITFLIILGLCESVYAHRYYY
ncbi:MAG: rod shape-determining protein RodA [Candidatus Euphemobacter frigidus]|nr:rod shape-determining protein RodA [Candidatus Euphemobacter frigidus]MDP8275072.1 rod shape-determining protein RodA [Candidatus Euphemobacter frigidus]